MCVCESITPEEDYHKSNSNVINLLCVDRIEREEISLQLTVSVFRTRRAADKTHKAGAGMIWSQLCILGKNRSRIGFMLSFKTLRDADKETHKSLVRRNTLTMK